MPKSQNTTTIRQARLAASESPDATDDDFNIHQRQAGRRLPKAANDLREALYADWRQPSDDEKELVYLQILAMVGSKYTPKAHSNFCTKKQRERTMGPRHESKPDDTRPPDLEERDWVSLWEVFRIVEAELSDLEVVKQRAKGECLMDSFTF